MIEQEKRRQDYYNASQIIKEIGIENPTGKQVLEYILGDSDLCNNSDFVVYRYSRKTSRTFINRLNLLWVLPLFFMIVPFQYLIKGNTGFNRNTKIGKIMDWLVKFE